MPKRDFHKQSFLFATNHGKAAAAVGPFATILHATVTELSIESDTLGTFSGEVERPGSMIDALRGKVALAQAATSAELIVVSEGAFCSLDGFGAFTQGTELLLVYDTKHRVEILEQHISHDTTHASSELRSEGDLERFMQRVLFGTHGLVLYPAGLPALTGVEKGIFDPGAAVAAFKRCLVRSPQRTVMALSDMRAHCNPTRMREIGICCELLARRLATPCPTCRSGGFGLVATVPGLPCAECGLPTNRARAEHHGCPYCGAKVERPRSDGVKSADPSSCPWCNP